MTTPKSSAPPKRRVLLKNVANAAIKALRTSPGDAIITSPFLTSEVAERVIGAADAKTAVVLIRFDAEVFICGGSDLAVVRRLLERNYALHALPGLHAKIVLTARKAYVGSQNLTLGGTRNREATAVVCGAGALGLLRADLQTWVRKSTPITPEMVAHMEELTAPLLEAATRLRTQAGDMDTLVREAEEARARERQQQAKRELRRHREQIRARFSKDLRDAASISEATLRLKLKPSQKKGGGEGHWVLERVDPRIDLTVMTQQPDGGAAGNAKKTGNEKAAKKDRPLEKRRRYLVAVPESGRLAWTGLNQARLSEFSPTVQKAGTINIGGIKYTIDAHANDDPETLDDWNIRFELHAPKAQLSVHAHFIIGQGFTIGAIAAGPRSRLTAATFKDHLAQHGDEVQRRFRKAALKPFCYEANRRAGLGRAAEFCGEFGETFRLQVIRYRTWPVFRLEPVRG
jgi:hypothetical protein